MSKQGCFTGFIPLHPNVERFIQEGALEDSLRSSTLLEGFGRCFHVGHSASEEKRRKGYKFKYLFVRIEL